MRASREKEDRDSSLLSRMKQNERTDGNGESELKGQGAELLRCLFEMPSWQNPHLPTSEAVGILSREITGEVSEGNDRVRDEAGRRNLTA